MAKRVEEDSMEFILENLSDRYYQMLRKDYTSGSKFSPFKHSTQLGEYTEAPFWDEDPKLCCGILVSRWHPLLLSSYLLDEYYSVDNFHRLKPNENYKFFEVETIPNPPLLVNDKIMNKMNSVYRAKSVVKIREVTATGPEFDTNLLWYLANSSFDGYVKNAALINLEHQKRKEYWLKIYNSEGGLDSACALRQLIKSGYGDSKFLVNAAKRFFGKTTELPGELISKITDTDVLLEILNKDDLKCVWGRGSSPSDRQSFHEWAIWRLRNLGRLDLLAQLKNHSSENVRTLVIRILSDHRY